MPVQAVVACYFGRTEVVHCCTVVGRRIGIDVEATSDWN